MAQLITILNGPNLNLLGQRQPEIYGHDTLDDVANSCTAVAAQFGLRCELMQSNHEGALIDMIHTARQTFSGHYHQPCGLHPYVDCFARRLAYL
jgi:3-dehydroquinate dehydratase-2